MLLNKLLLCYFMNSSNLDSYNITKVRYKVFNRDCLISIGTNTNQTQSKLIIKNMQGILSVESILVFFFLVLLKLLLMFLFGFLCFFTAGNRQNSEHAYSRTCLQSLLMLT